MRRDIRRTIPLTPTSYPDAIQHLIDDNSGPLHPRIFQANQRGRYVSYWPPSPLAIVSEVLGVGILIFSTLRPRLGQNGPILIEKVIIAHKTCTRHFNGCCQPLIVAGFPDLRRGSAQTKVVLNFAFPGQRWPVLSSSAPRIAGDRDQRIAGTHP